MGRGQEVGRLVRLLEERSAVVVVGEAGMGKTTLVRAAAEKVGRPVYEGGGLATLSWMPLLPLARAIGRDLEGDPAFVAREIEEHVGDGVLFVDDVQWTDAATRRVLPLLAERLSFGAAVRSGDPAAQQVLEGLAQAGFERLELSPLGAEDAASVARRARPDLQAAALRELVRRAGGNPLLLEELAAAGEPSVNLRGALKRRLELLSPSGRDAFVRLTLLGRPAERELVGAGVAELVEEGLAEVDHDAFAIRHALLAEAVAAELSDEEARRVHRGLAQALSDPGEAARHHLAAGEREQAVQLALRAAALATAPGERAEHLRLAANAADSGAEQLRLEAAQTLLHAHELQAADELLAELSGDDPESQALVEWVRAGAAFEHGDSSTAHEAIERGLDAVEGLDSPAEVRLRTMAAQVAMFVDHDMAEARTLAEEAVAVARRRGEAEADALRILGCSLATGDDIDPDRSEQCLERAAILARADEDRITEFKALYNWFFCGHVPLYDYERARPRAVELVALARNYRLASYERQSRALLGRIDYHAAAYDSVIANYEELLAEALHPQTRLMLYTYLIPSLVDLGEFERAEAHIEGLRAAPSSRGSNPVVLHWALAELAFWGGRPRVALDEARAALDPEASTLGTGYELFAAVIGSWAAVELGLETLETVEPVTPDEPHVRALTVELDGIAALRAGTPEEAAARLDEASGLAARCDRRSELRSLWGAAEAARTAGDVAGARRRLELVEEQCRVLGMQPLLARAQRSLRLVGARRTAPRVRAGRLTAREREVLDLVGAGLSNPEIGRRLGVSPKAVEHAISSAARKLGVRTRVQAAAAASSES